MIWIFGFGSLTFDGWQAEFGCLSYQRATLHGYRRAFNKKSVVNLRPPIIERMAVISVDDADDEWTFFKGRKASGVGRHAIRMRKVAGLA